MNIAYLSNSAIPSRTANSVHVMKMCQAFADNGNQVRLYARRGPLQSDVSRHYGVEKSFDLCFSDYPAIPGLSHFVYSRQVARTVRGEPLPDLLYARHIYSLYGLRNSGCALIYEAHSSPANPLQRHMESRLCKHPRLQRFVVISEALRGYYLKLFPHLDPERIQVAHDAADPVDLTAATDGPAWTGRRDAPQIGYTGHLYPGKGMELIAELAPRLPGMDFHVIGGTEADVARWRQDCDSPNLFLHGFVPHGRLNQYYRHLDVLIAPYQARVAAAGSKGNIADWMSPLKLFEYMSAGKPIVCSDLPVLREVLEHDRTALLAPATDPDAWARALNRLAREPDLGESIATAAHQQFLDHHTWQQRAAAVLR